MNEAASAPHPILEDLRDRSLTWHIDIRRKKLCEIRLEGAPFGYILRTAIWRGRYAADLTGIRWEVLSNSLGLRSVDRLVFAGQTDPLASAQAKGDDYEAEVDGAYYRLHHEEPSRLVWRDDVGQAVASFTHNPNPKMEFRWRQGGLIHVFQACDLARAPCLSILGLIQIVYRNLFLGRTVSPSTEASR